VLGRTWAHEDPGQYLQFQLSRRKKPRQGPLFSRNAGGRGCSLVEMRLDAGNEPTPGVQEAEGWNRGSLERLVTK
jgi:hypothetical protein